MILVVLNAINYLKTVENVISLEIILKFNVMIVKMDIIQKMIKTVFIVIVLVYLEDTVKYVLIIIHYLKNVGVIQIMF